MIRPVFAVLILALAALAPPPAAACGADTDCALGDRAYRIRMPEGHDDATPVGAIMFLHGFRGSAAGVMRNGSLGRAVSELGLALIAPEAGGEDWALAGSPHPAGDEIAYFDALRADVTARFPIDPEQIVVAGFSAGGMMAWTLACARPADYAGFVPVAGTFWEPIPETCATPVANILQVHGLTDRTVPLAGRALGTKPLPETGRPPTQGNVAEAFKMYRALGGFVRVAPAGEKEGLKCERWANPAGKLLELCLHPGGHSFRTEFITRAWGVLQEAGAVGR